MISNFNLLLPHMIGIRIKCIKSTFKKATHPLKTNSQETKRGGPYQLTDLVDTTTK